MIYHVSHERVVYPELGIPGNDVVVQRAMPKVVRALEVMEQELSDGRPFIVGDTATMADYFLLPTLFAFGLTPEGKHTLPKYPTVVAWDNRMDALPSVVHFNAKLPPRAPIEHARQWIEFHRPAARRLPEASAGVQAPRQTVYTVQALLYNHRLHFLENARCKIRLSSIFAVAACLARRTRGASSNRNRASTGNSIHAWILM
jgi:hypothetical protein